ncbi:MAG: PQQ-binding-like beta-propeller repeat protein [Verrucomicrobiota bacterium]|nr:PQQ-binding-like beta-propeller repeat protein [Verrucomicrobiota bacterium]
MTICSTKARAAHLLVFWLLIQLPGYCSAPLEWTFTTVSRTVWSKGEITASPSVGRNGLVYFGAKDYTFYAVDSANGKAAWKYRTHGAITSSAAIDGNSVVYFGSEDSQIYALEGAKGGLVWKFETGGKVRSSPALSNLGILYVGSDDKNVYALDTADGTKLWKFTTGGKVSSSVALAEGLAIYFGSEDGSVYSLDADTGEKIWSFRTGAGVTASPVIGHNNSVIVGSGDNYLYCLNGRTGKLKWRTFLNGPVNSSAAIGPSGRIIVGGGSDTLYQLNPADGAIVRRYKSRGAIASSPAVGNDGVIYFGSNDRRVYAVELNGEKVWSYQTSGRVISSPAISPDGRVYIGSEDHKLYAFNAKQNGVALGQTLGPAFSSWPMFGKNSRRLPGLIEQANKAAPSIVFQPRTQTRPLGERAALIAEVHGQGPFEYQWHKDGQPLAGQTQAVLQFEQAAHEDSGDYFVSIENAFGLTHSFPVTLTITKPQPAQIVLHPKPVKAEYGQTIQLKATARGSGTVEFVWHKDGQPLQSTAGGGEVLNDYSPLEGYYSILTLKSLQTTDEGLYSVVASNPYGTMESGPARLTVGSSGHFRFSSSRTEDDGYFRLVAVGPIGHEIVVQESSNFVRWRDMMTLTLNKPVVTGDQPEGQADLGTVELRLPVLPVGEDLEQKKVEIAVQLSKQAIAKRISAEQGIEVDPDSLEVELIFILSRDDSRAQQLRQGYPIDPNHSSVLRRLEKGSFYRFRLVEGSAAAP